MNQHWGLIEKLLKTMLHYNKVKTMKLKHAYITIENEDGNIIERISMTAADDDWIRAGRLRKKAGAGDKEAVYSPYSSSFSQSAMISSLRAIASSQLAGMLCQP